ncbi:hypothetical protein GQ457_06G016480 [Hibiscus cannabinus]
MLQTALTYKDVFLRCVLLHGDPLYKHLPTEDDWTFAAKICEKFVLFYEMTEDFSGTKYSTANLYFPHICSIRVTLNEWAQDNNATISSMARRMFAKFEKYWSVVNGIMGVATLLDPRYKTDFLECYFEDTYGVDAEYELEKIVQLCRDLVKEYEAKIMMFLFQRRKKRKSKVLSQLDRYLDEDVIHRTPNFDILNWWKRIGPQFPILQAIARDIYAIPVSTVASESSFSTGGRLVNPQRNRLHPSTVEALACCQSWLTGFTVLEGYFDVIGSILEVGNDILLLGNGWGKPVWVVRTRNWKLRGGENRLSGLLEGVSHATERVVTRPRRPRVSRGFDLSGMLSES